MLPSIKPSKKLIYLDHAATTPIDPRVARKMRPYEAQSFGNPSGLYKLGQEGNKAISEARLVVADALGSRPNEVVFTAGGTESINLALFGAARQYEKTYTRKGHIISSKIEHHAVLACLEALRQDGWKITLLDVETSGLIKMSQLKKSVRDDTVLISIMQANNEIGTIEPIAEISKWLRGVNAKRKHKILFHIDSCQAAGSLDINVNHLGVDLLSANGSKIYGPKQTGFLYLRSGVKLQPIIFGGGQERGLRSGTENVGGIVGLAEALKLARGQRIKENSRLRVLRDYFISQILKNLNLSGRVILNGPDERGLTIKEHGPFGRGSSLPKRLPNNINVSMAGIDGEALMLYLDSYNIAVSTGSACSTTIPDPSHVILALGRSKAQAGSSIRFTLGHTTTKRDLDYVIKVLPMLVKELRRVK